MGRNCGKKVDDAVVDRAVQLSSAGMSDLSIAKTLGVGRSVVERILARVGPNGQLMPTMYGDPGNNPTKVRRHAMVVCGNEVPVPNWRQRRPN